MDVEQAQRAVSNLGVDLTSGRDLVVINRRDGELVRDYEARRREAGRQLAKVQSTLRKLRNDGLDITFS